MVLAGVDATKRFALNGEIAALAELDPADVSAAWRRLHEAHALVLDGEGAIVMANPFSGVPTPFRVLADGRWWFANCAWDAFGVCSALHCTIETSCRDCDEPIVVHVRDGRPDVADLVFHCLVPAKEWWDDIGFTEAR